MGISKGFCANKKSDYELITSQSKSTTQFSIVQESSTKTAIARPETPAATQIYSTFLTPRFTMADSN